MAVHSETLPQATEGPLTVAITRRVHPEDELLMQAWVHAGTSMAERFDGFLGAGWVRSGDEDWHMLYRFDSRAHLDAWERSTERTRWLRSAADLVEHRRTEYRTGIEGWFDAPFATHVESRTAAKTAVPTGPIQQPIPVAPPRWKQAVTIWLGFFPTNLLASWLLGFVPGFTEWPLVLRVLFATLALTPVMTYLVLPWVTRMLRPWLQRSA